MRLVADAMLGRLAKWLRVLGYDTLYWRGDDAGLVRLAVAERRLLLTRDTRLPPRLPPGQSLFIKRKTGPQVHRPVYPLLIERHPRSPLPELLIRSNAALFHKLDN